MFDLLTYCNSSYSGDQMNRNLTLVGESEKGKEEPSFLSQENSRLREELKRVYDYVSEAERTLEKRQTEKNQLEEDYREISRKLNETDEKAN